MRSYGLGVSTYFAATFTARTAISSFVVDPEHFTLRNYVVHEACYVMDKDQIVS